MIMIMIIMVMMMMIMMMMIMIMMIMIMMIMIIMIIVPSGVQNSRIVIGSPRAYLSRNRTARSRGRCEITSCPI